MKEDSAGIVNGYIIPRLGRIVSKERMPAKLKARIKSLVPVAEGLKVLPLSLCHIDINQMNVIVDENANIAGLVDWEQAQLLPVGMNTWCIRYLSVPNRNRVDYPDEDTVPMAEAFWKGLVSTLPNHILGLLDKVVDAMAIGVVMNVFEWLASRASAPRSPILWQRMGRSGVRSERRGLEASQTSTRTSEWYVL
jgi:hypothetical protein